MSNIRDVRCKPGLGISWNMAAMLCDVVVVVGRTCPRSGALPLLSLMLTNIILLLLDLVVFRGLFCEELLLNSLSSTCMQLASYRSFAMDVLLSFCLRCLLRAINILRLSDTFWRNLCVSSPEIQGNLAAISLKTKTKNVAMFSVVLVTFFYDPFLLLYQYFAEIVI